MHRTYLLIDAIYIKCLLKFDHKTCDSLNDVQHEHYRTKCNLYKIVMTFYFILILLKSIETENYPKSIWRLELISIEPYIRTKS